MIRHRKLILIVLAFTALLAAAIPAFAIDTAVSGNIASGAQYDLWALDLIAGESVVATLVCDFDGVSRPLDPVLSVFFPGSDTSDTIFADAYNDDGFGSDDDPNGVDCDAFDSSRVFFTAPVAGTYIFRADGFGSSTGPYTLTIRTGSSNPLAGDGRINPHAHAPVVLYCDGTSTTFFSVTGTDLGSVENGGSASFAGVNVSPTADGRMELTAPMNGGKTYWFIWDGCPSGSSITYTIENGVPIQFASGTYGGGK